MREIILKRFNKDQLGMEEGHGSDMNKIIGMGLRDNPHTKTKEAVVDTYPSYSRAVMDIFEIYPVAEYFGLNYKDAMELPIDQWADIREAAEKLPPHNRVSLEAQLMELLRAVLTPTEGGG